MPTTSTLLIRKLADTLEKNKANVNLISQVDPITGLGGLQRSFALRDFGVRKILFAQIHQKTTQVRFHLLFKLETTDIT